MTLVARGVLDPTKIQSLAERVKHALVLQRPYPEAELLQCAASLASCGLLGPVDWLCLQDVDLSQVPEEKLISLVSSVTLQLCIGQNVTGWVNLLPHLRCWTLHIKQQTLGREETQALVRAMEVGVKKVELWKGVTLEMEVLFEYSGKGVCHKVDLWSYHNNIEDVRTWAKRRNWGYSIIGDWMSLMKE